MKKIDHVKKTVYIIVGILTIISLVFSLYKKIGHCASDSSSPIPFDPPPYLWGNDIGGSSLFSQSLILNMVDYAITDYTNFNNNTVVVLKFGNRFYVVILKPDKQAIPSNYTDLQKLNYYQSYEFELNGTYFNSYSNGQIDFRPYNITETVSGDPLYKLNYDADGYPIYVYNQENFVFTNDIQVFSDQIVPVGPIGHSKGGVLSNYVDSEDLLENSSDLPKVDTTPPADPSSNAGWFQKILNGIGRLNQSVQGGVLTIGDYIGAGIEKLEEKLGEVKDSITGLYGWFTEDFDKNQFQNGINSIPLISDLNGLKTLVENSGMFNWSDVSPAQSVSFTFDFGGAVLPHSTNTIDFSWYTGNVKTICNAILCTFLVLGLFVTVVNQIPSIIGGHSGDKGGGSDS